MYFNFTVKIPDVAGNLLYEQSRKLLNKSCITYATNPHAGFCNENNRKGHDFKTSHVAGF